MDSEIIVTLVCIAIAVGFIVWVRKRDRGEGAPD